MAGGHADDAGTWLLLAVTLASPVVIWRKFGSTFM
jgi:hypothetical protein